MKAGGPRLAVVVQARMSSRRLPGKVLLPLHGKPMLAHTLERLLSGQPYPVVVATSGHPSDDPLAEFCAGQGVTCLRGPLDNVAARFLLASQVLGLDAFIRVCGDSPLIDPKLVTRAVELFCAQEADLAGNVHPRSFPQGQSVEVVAVEAFRRALSSMAGQEEREHVTLHFYRHAQRYRVVNFAHDEDFSQVRLVVDTARDLSLMADLMGRMTVPSQHYGWRELVRLASQTTSARREEARVA